MSVHQLKSVFSRAACLWPALLFAFGLPKSHEHAFAKCHPPDLTTPIPEAILFPFGYGAFYLLLIRKVYLPSPLPIPLAGQVLGVHKPCPFAMFRQIVEST